MASAESGGPLALPINEKARLSFLDLLFDLFISGLENCKVTGL
jgi:hypothetical protein